MNFYHLSKYHITPNRVIKITLFVVVLGLIIACYRLAIWPIRELDRCLVISTIDGIVLVDDSGCKEERTVLSRDGKLLKTPRFVAHGSQFLYWSAPDSALRLVSNNGKRSRWYPLDQQASGPNWHAKRMSTDGRFVAIDFGSRLAKQSVSLLELKSGRWQRLSNVVQARLDPSGTGEIVLHTMEGEFLVGSIMDEKDRHLISTITKVWDWDYDFNRKTLYVLESTGNRICIQNRAGIVKYVRLPIARAGMSVFWNARHGELWVGSHGPFSMSCKPCVFSGDGRYLGALHTAGPPFYIQGMDCKTIYCFKESLNRVPSQQ